MTTAIQGQTFDVLFALRDVISPGEPLLNAFPGGVIPANAIRIVKPGAAIAAATGTIFENGVGWYTYSGTSGESNLGLAAGSFGELGIHVNLATAVGHQSFTIQVSSVGAGALTAAERTAGAAAVDAALLDNFAALASGITAVPAAVIAAPIDGELTLGAGVADARAGLCGNAQLPNSAAGGPIEYMGFDGVTPRYTGAIDADGLRTETV